MINKDFLKQVLGEEKELIPISDIRFINVPMYDELSVKRLWPEMQGSRDFMKFFPDKLPKGRLPDRDYFFNVMNTVNHEYTSELIKHANEQRHSMEHAREELDAIEVTEGWLDKLNSQPFISRKSRLSLNKYCRLARKDPPSPQAEVSASASKQEEEKDRDLCLAHGVFTEAVEWAQLGGGEETARAPEDQYCKVANGLPAHGTENRE